MTTGLKPLSSLSLMCTNFLSFIVGSVNHISLGPFISNSSPAEAESKLIAWYTNEREHTAPHRTAAAPHNNAPHGPTHTWSQGRIIVSSRVYWESSLTTRLGRASLKADMCIFRQTLAPRAANANTYAGKTLLRQYVPYPECISTAQPCFHRSYPAPATRQ